MLALWDFGPSMLGSSLASKNFLGIGAGYPEYRSSFAQSVPCVVGVRATRRKAGLLRQDAFGGHAPWWIWPVNYQLRWHQLRVVTTREAQRYRGLSPHPRCCRPRLLTWQLRRPALSRSVKLVASGIKRKMKKPLTMSPAMYRLEEEAWISN